MVEKRRKKRLLTHMPVSIVHRGKLFSLATRDVSLEGVFVIGEISLGIRDGVHVVFSGRGWKGESIEMHGTVVRRENAPDPGFAVQLNHDVIPTDTLRQYRALLSQQALDFLRRH